MLKVILFIASLVAGLVAIVTAMLIPSHLRAADEQVIRQVGRGSPGVVDFGLQFLPEKVSTAKLLLKAANDLDLTHTLRFSSGIQAAEDTGSAWRNPPFHSQSLQGLLSGPADYQFISTTPFLEVMRNRITRGKFEEAIDNPDALHVLKNLNLTNTTLFAPASSAAGVPFEVAVLSTSLMMQEQVFGPLPTSPLREEILNLARMASRTNANPALEEFYVDVFALAKRLTWEQMTIFVGRFKTIASLDRTVRFMQENNDQVPIIFAAVAISQNPENVSDYLAAFSDDGFKDMRIALAAGSSAFNQLIDSQQPIYHTAWREGFVRSLHLERQSDSLVRMAASSPILMMFLKFDLLFVGAFLVVYAFKFLRSTEGQGYVWFPQFRFARQLVFSVLLLGLLVVLGEPYLAQGQAKEPPPVTPQWNLPLLADVSNSTPQSSGPMINASTFVALGIFFVLQASLYTIGLVKLAEIRRQPLPSAMKLKLLDNEENLFDAGLYAGLFGTASSLVLLTLGVIKPSLMSAYASTLFGILFVAILKILHVRPLKRQLIIASQEEAQAA